MAKVTVEISMSLDGCVAGPEPSLEDPLGRGGEQLHEWALATAAWRESHGRAGGERGVDDDLMRQSVERAGATVMGRRMFSGGAGPWEDDPRAQGWWGEEPPFRHPVFVVTHHERDPLELTGTTFAFVTDGVEAAVEQARAAAGDRDVRIGGGGQVIRQAVDAGLVDELDIHLAPVLLGPGTPLFGGAAPRGLELAHAIESPAGVVHLRYVLR